MQFVDTEVAKTGMSERAWCEQHGISQSQMGKWRTSQTVPSLRSIETIAEALGQPAIGLAAIALGVDIKGHAAVKPARPVSIVDAIAGDPSLTDADRRILGDLLTSLYALREPKSKRRKRSL